MEAGRQLVECAGQQGGRDPEGAWHHGRRGEAKAFQLGFLQSFRLGSEIISQLIGSKKNLSKATLAAVVKDGQRV